MLSCRRLPLTDAEAAKLKNWLLLPEAFKFRNLLMAEIAFLQVQAVNAQVEALQYPNREIDQKQHMDEIAMLKSVLKILEIYADDPSQLALSQIEVTQIPG